MSVQREDDHAFAQHAGGIDAARSTLAACREAGLDAQWLEEADVPFPFHGGVCLRNQAQFDPMPVLGSLIVELETHGGTLLQGVRATSISRAGPPVVAVRTSTVAEDGHNDQFRIAGQHCVLATGTPILDRGLFFARLVPHRSYCMAFDVPGDIIRAMFISVDSPTRSVRYTPAPTGVKLIGGGAGHPVGRADTPSRAITELAHWTALHYPGAVRTHFWSAQDYTPVGELPYVGPLLPRCEKILFATGFDKWGMSNGVAAALVLAARVLGGHVEWARAFASWHAHDLAGVSTAAQANLMVGLHLAKGWLAPLASASDPPSDGEGVVSGPPWRLLRRQRGRRRPSRTVSPVCPHLGGIVAWNDADHAWECLLHGSRLAPDGSVLEGPATRGLSCRAQTG